MRPLLGLALLVLGSSCGERIAGVTVDVVAHVSPLSANESLAVDQAHLRVSSLTLTACEGLGATLWRAISPVSQAWAHGGETQDAEGSLEPVVISLSEPGAQYLGSVLPLPGRYCEAELVLGPSSSRPSLRVAGLRTVADSAAPFEVSTQAQRSVRLPIAVTLDEEHRVAQLDLKLGSLSLGSNVDAPDAAVTMLDQLARSVRVP